MMRKVATVQWISAIDRSLAVRHLGEGDQVTFGTCFCEGCDLDIVISKAKTSQVRGAITAFQDYWKLDNLDLTAELIARDVEDPRQHVRLAPGRLGVPIPFELTCLEDCKADAGKQFVIFGPEPVFATGPPNVCRTLGTGEGPRLDKDATYYAVLEELCEPWLRGSTHTPLPTTRDIVRRLHRRNVVLTPKAVDHRL